MKKYLSLIAIAMMAVFSLSLASCGDDSDNEFEATVVGTWEVTYVTASSSFDIDEDEGLKVGDRMTFYADGRFLDSEGPGKWVKNGNTLTVTTDEDYSVPAIMIITKLTDTILEVKLDYGSIIKFEIKMKRVS